MERLTLTIDRSFLNNKRKGKVVGGDEPDTRPQEPDNRKHKGKEPANFGEDASRSQTAMDVDPTGNGAEGDNERDDEPNLSSGIDPKNLKSHAVKHKRRQENDWQQFIRQSLETLMGGKDVDPLEDKVTPEEVKEFASRYSKNRTERPCKIEDFRIFLAGGPKSAWNLGAANVFADYLEQSGAFKEFTLETCNQVTQSFLFDQLGVDGMSSDEEDFDVPPMMPTSIQFKVAKPVWRSDELGNFLQKLDGCHIESRIRRDNLLGPSFG
ncbi:hypothetical protein GYMLUDRAFT_248233 [Collybiopsis luxurians FD-317 M1]|uniref:Unplaced genomic scaffold GYMLUscaffold_53, whole genome shotgun sequence n=1 Tax=Collybiopsis luxurians FD-317 M1 TaxID=944289 RepID=A0A0D0AZ75_9AGAR|nr:hypothetical protein GYMLUDRAFT_248233 [Collybiopsis luxurians FD-317 M1]